MHGTGVKGDFGAGTSGHRQSLGTDSHVEGGFSCTLFGSDLDVECPTPAHRKIECRPIAPLTLGLNVRCATHLLHGAHRRHRVSDFDVAGIYRLAFAIPHGQVECVALLPGWIGFERRFNLKTACLRGHRLSPTARSHWGAREPRDNALVEHGEHNQNGDDDNNRKNPASVFHENFSRAHGVPPSSRNPGICPVARWS